MPGRWINKQQVKIYMNARSENKGQITAAAMAGISERTGRDIEKGLRQDPRDTERSWRTRKDPLASVWDSELVPLLEKAPGLCALTLLEHLQYQHPEQYPDNLLRTLQRRVKKWHAVSGTDKEVIFRQEHLPGLMGLSDFTTLKGIEITIKGNPFSHILYHFRLAFSHWSYMKVIQGGESYTALAEGLSSALNRLGGSPANHRTDSLSAAFKNLSNDEAIDITTRYEVLCAHYQMTATRNNRGVSHENGSVESAHGHVKRRIEQALLLRASHDFASVEAYQSFIDEVVQTHNRRNARLVNEERTHLQALPAQAAIDYTEVIAKVSSTSTIDIKRVTYSVPSRLIGECLKVRVYDDRLKCYLGLDHVLTLTRQHTVGNLRTKVIDYRHLIASLVKKPQAFRYSQLRESILPNEIYKEIWQYADKTLPARAACKFMVGVLHLAATENCEDILGDYLLKSIANNTLPSLTMVQGKFRSKTGYTTPNLDIEQHPLKQYNALLNRGEAYAASA